MPTEPYLELPRSAGNDHPLTQRQKTGVDLSQHETVQAVVDQMQELVSLREAWAAKIRGGA